MVHYLVSIDRIWMYPWYII